MHLEWAEKLQDDCKRMGVAFWMKQLGAVPRYRDELYLHNGNDDDMQAFPVGLRSRQFPKQKGS
jgi:protein gp37